MSGKKKFIALATLIASWPAVTLAQSDILQQIQKTGRAAYGSGIPTDPKIIVANIVTYILSFVGVIFICLIIYAGFRWMSSGGNEKTIDSAKDTLRSAVIGLTLVIVGYAIASFIGLALSNASNNATPRPAPPTSSS